MRLHVVLSAAALVTVCIAADTKARQGPNHTFDPALYQALQFRNIGPHRGGRVTAVEGIAEQPFTFYMGATGGGVWRSTTGGQTWHNVSDGFFSVGSIGAIDVADSDPTIIYVGTGSSAFAATSQPGRASTNPRMELRRGRLSASKTPGRSFGSWCTRVIRISLAGMGNTRLL